LWIAIEEQGHVNNLYSGLMFPSELGVENITAKKVQLCPPFSPETSNDTIFLQSKEASMRIINQYSFVLVVVVVWLGLAAFLLRDGVKTTDILALAALAAGFGLAFWLLRPGPSSLDETEQVMVRIGAGKPVLLEFQSNF
jgi:hypothetical protein